MWNISLDTYIFGSQVIEYRFILRNCAEQILLVLLSYCYIEMGSKYFLKIYHEAIWLRLYIWKQISNSKIKALFSNVNIPHKRISIKIFLPWSDTPNWQGMGRKWLVECVFRSMCAQLALIWQPKNTRIFQVSCFIHPYQYSRLCDHFQIARTPHSHLHFKHA